MMAALILPDCRAYRYAVLQDYSRLFKQLVDFIVTFATSMRITVSFPYTGCWCTFILFLFSCRQYAARAPSRELLSSEALLALSSASGNGWHRLKQGVWYNEKERLEIKFAASV